MYLFGASKLGMIAYEFFQEEDIKGFIDNNRELNEHCGLPVYHIDEINDTDVKILITSSYYREIAWQLNQKGFNNYQIFSVQIIDKEQIDFEYENFNSKKYWEDRYTDGGNSGAGSYDKLAEYKADIINNFIKKKKIIDVIEWGCGDGNQLGKLSIVNYTGYDVSKTVVRMCKEKYLNDSSKKFIHFDGNKLILDEKAEMSLSLDVIYHLIEDDVFESYLYNLFSNSKKYICIYSSNFNRFHAAHVKDRVFTDYVKRLFPEWRLMEIIENPLKNQEPTDSDFYFYEKYNG
ncbi:methyltransferase domain-containing protein [Lysinibacillus capsici]|uniref:methyltransferase domain-containing protein n=1 Tax=Lysinibacillus capsici TaxID=2115968 RepID=UPI002E1AEA04|nr:hypothetical protein [Lysinibacillus capsici]